MWSPVARTRSTYVAGRFLPATKPSGRRSPRESGVGSASKPTLAVAMKSRLGRLLADAHAQEQAALEQMEVRFAEQRAQGEVAARASTLATELAQRKKMSELTVGVLEAEFQIDVQRELSRIQAAEHAVSRMAADRAQKDAALQVEQAKSDARVRELEQKVRELESKVALRELPSHVKSRLGLLAAPGFWKPQLARPSTFLEGRTL